MSHVFVDSDKTNFEEEDENGTPNGALRCWSPELGSILCLCQSLKARRGSTDNLYFQRERIMTEEKRNRDRQGYQTIPIKPSTPGRVTLTLVASLLAARCITFSVQLAAC